MVNPPAETLRGLSRGVALLMVAETDPFEKPPNLSVSAAAGWAANKPLTAAARTVDLILMFIVSSLINLRQCMQREYVSLRCAWRYLYARCFAIYVNEFTTNKKTL